MIPKKKLSDIAVIYNGNSINKTVKQHKYMKDVPGWNYIGTKDIDFDGSVTYKTGVVIPFSESKFRTAPMGTVFVCSEGGSAGKKTAIIKEEVCFGNKLFAIVNKDDLFIPQYVYYYTRYGAFLKQFKLLASTLMGGITAKNFGNIEIPLPRKVEQQRIVSRIEELFSSLDNAVETLNKTKELLTVYRQAVLKEAFGKFTKKKRIKEVSNFVTSGSRGWAKYYNGTGARFIRITDLTRDDITLKNDNIQHVKLPENAEGKRSRLIGNDVLVSITADLGSIALIPENIQEAYINQHIAMIRFNNPMQGKFMAWYLKSNYGQKDLLKNKRGGGKLGLGLDDIRDTLVPIVDDEEAMMTVKQIDARLSACDNIKNSIDVIQKQAEAMRQSILKEAFEGRLK